MKKKTKKICSFIQCFLYFISYYPDNNDENIIFNNLQLGKVRKFNYEEATCEYEVITVECGQIVPMGLIKQIECKQILIIDKKIHNVYTIGQCHMIMDKLL